MRQATTRVRPSRFGRARGRAGVRRGRRDRAGRRARGRAGRAPERRRIRPAGRRAGPPGGGAHRRAPARSRRAGVARADAARAICARSRSSAISARRSSSSARGSRGASSAISTTRPRASLDARAQARVAAARPRGAPGRALQARQRRLPPAAARRGRPARHGPRVPVRLGAAVGSTARRVARAPAHAGRTCAGAGALVTARREQVRRTRATVARTRDAAARPPRPHEDLIRRIDERRDLAAPVGRRAAGRPPDAAAHARGRRAGTPRPPAPSPALPLRPFKGDLDWPVPGRCAARFGRQRNRRFHTAIAVERHPRSPPRRRRRCGPSTTARSPSPTPFPGFGNLVIVDHGGLAFSLYGYLADIASPRAHASRAGRWSAAVGRRAGRDARALLRVAHRRQAGRSTTMAEAAVIPRSMTTRTRFASSCHHGAGPRLRGRRRPARQDAAAARRRTRTCASSTTSSASRRATTSRRWTSIA